MPIAAVYGSEVYIVDVVFDDSAPKVRLYSDTRLLSEYLPDRSSVCDGRYTSRHCTNRNPSLPVRPESLPSRQCTQTSLFRSGMDDSHLGFANG